MHPSASLTQSSSHPDNDYISHQPTRTCLVSLGVASLDDAFDAAASAVVGIATAAVVASTAPVAGGGAVAVVKGWVPSLLPLLK